jgi:hypothetical protein
LSDRSWNNEEEDKELKKYIDNQNLNVRYKFMQMLVLDKFRWTFMGEADSYRRRPFPMKFLKNECSDYPVYVFTSELSKAFDDVPEIKVIVDLSEFEDIIKILDKRKDIKYEYKEKESLVTST